MPFTKRNYQSIESRKGLHMMRDSLKLEKQGFSVLEVDKGYEGLRHDHADKGHEEVYFLIEGSAAVEVDGKRIEMVPGDALRVSPEAERQITADEESTFVISGAP